MNFNYTCPNCQLFVKLEVQIDSPSEYYLLDERCPECNVKFHNSIYDEIASEVMDYYILKAEYFCDR